MMNTREMSRTYSGVRVMPSSTTRPFLMRGDTVRRMASGCSMISLNMKWG